MEQDHRSNVDSSRPFRSVKEAVAIFGEIYSKKETPPYFSVETEAAWKCSPPSLDTGLADTVKKLEAELEDTKNELKLLKERESETEIAIAALNAELHKSMSKVARAEAAEAARAAEKRDLIGQSLGQVLGVGEKEGLFLGRKKKPIIPLLGDLFSRKKTLQNPLFHYNSTDHGKKEKKSKQMDNLIV